MDEPRGEFDLIERFFRPLAGPGALALADDAAVLPPPPAGTDLVATCDTMVAGTHFLDADPADAIAHKLLAVNLSDLAAMGADPAHYLLATSWHAVPPDAWLERFAAGLGAMQRDYGILLAGGDTTRTAGPLTLTLTALGTVPHGQALRRSTARPGDLVFVSGTIGDAALALRLAGTGVAADLVGLAQLVARLQRPTPRLALGRALRGVASAAMDVSDGLVGDLGHIVAQSGCGAELRAAAIPVSDAAARLLADEPDLMADVLGGGDDYELLFTAPPARRDDVLRAAAAAATPVAEIGRMTAAGGVTVLDRDGAPLSIQRTGFRHF
ncbi:MAG: thiamine-phosphate kinase [Alphaproteobacteria bacterium]